LKEAYGTFQSIAGGGEYTSVDDATTGTGNYQWQYSGTWGVTTGATDGRYDGTSHWSNTASSTATMTFVGDRIQVFTNKSAGGGYADISIDGGAATQVDTYSSDYGTDEMVWDSGNLSEGTHTITVEATGTNDGLSTNAWVDLDRALVYTDSPSIIPDTATGTGLNQIGYSGTWGGPAMVAITAHRTGRTPRAARQR